MSLAHYSVHGLVVVSEVELPIPPSDPGPADVTYRVAIDSAPLPLATHRRDDGTDEPWSVEHWAHGRLIVEFPGSATFEVTRAVVTLLADDTEDPDLTAHLFLDHVMPRVVALSGDLMLHGAGAVGPSGRAHVFVGESGAGKSTLAAGMAVLGWALLDDDGIRVIDRDGVAMAVPGYAGIRLWPDSAASILADAVPGRPMSRDMAKRRFTVDGTHMTMADGPAPIAGVYIVERVDATESAATILGFTEALTTLVEHGFHLADEPAAITRQAFERASALAANVPVLRLRHPDGLTRLASAQALMTQLDDAD